MGLWTCKLVRELPRPLGQDEGSGISIGECKKWGNNEKKEGGWRWLYLRPAHRVGVVNQLVEVVEVLFDREVLEVEARCFGSVLRRGLGWGMGRLRGRWGRHGGCEEQAMGFDDGHIVVRMGKMEQGFEISNGARRTVRRLSSSGPSRKLENK